MSIKDLDKEYIANTYKRFDVEIVGGKGSIAYDANGKEYIDLGSGIGVNTFGYSDAEWVKAVAEQAQKLSHTSNLYYTQPSVELAKMLCEATGFSKVFFSNSGAEANECAIKLARKYSAEKKSADTFTIVSLKNSFHGRTLTTLAATGQDVFHSLYNPLTPGFVSVIAGNNDEFTNTIKNIKVAGVILECIQGEGGVNIVSKDYVDFVAKTCQQNDIPLIIDEVQTGNGRTGSLYCYMNYGINPDIITTAKGLGGGLPIGATLMNKKFKDVFGPSDHGSTFGANPIACAGAVSIFKRLTPKFLNEVKEKGEYIKKCLESCKKVNEIAQMGMMVGFKTQYDSGELIQKFLESGVLTLKAKDKVRLLPPLNIDKKDLSKALDVIVSCLN